MRRRRLSTREHRHLLPPSRPAAVTPTLAASTGDATFKGKYGNSLVTLRDSAGSRVRSGN